ncbi:UvrD-like helicase, ATP-binding domain, P-loop containing nucleoside triphosphate hydrolase [Tanacetum coccineum]
MIQLKQNFRTHAGVLDLAQSVIDLLYHYFVHSIDNLEPETSLISGEAPVLLESGDDENAIATIFGGGGSGVEIVGFGAEQVILVRDEHTKAEICEYVGRQALVLTIVECKGLEFQDVLLYKFFGTSPFKDQWRVLYEYMKKHDWLDAKHPQSFPTFSEERHSVLCSELKQLYVAITRTRQRLWICEKEEELSKPMFDYWKMKGLVQIRKLDVSVAQAMRVASSPQEWRERGKKFFYENNFVMAKLCFEKAGDTMWEKMAKASDLRASADQMRRTNHEAFRGYVREAAEMFESIGKLEYAASCYCDLGEYERAGKIYMDTCGKIVAAAECYSLAGCFSEAAEAYANGDQFSNCLSVCKEGKLFDKGLEYIKYWKERVNVRSKQIQNIEQEFLESCAFEYHEHNDPKSMMKFVQEFYSMESKRVFLTSVGCLSDLILLDEASGQFSEAAELARSLGDVIKEADLLEKVGHFKEAALLLLWYVYFSSLWGDGNSGWPLKRFPQKKVLCKKAKLLAKRDSDVFCDFVCSELKVLCDHYNSLRELKNGLDVSQKNRSLRGEILLIRKILDKHIYLNISKYEWEDELPIDMNKYCEEKMFQNQVSVRTLVFYWNSWKENVVRIFENLRSFHKNELHEDFLLFYFGVRKHNVNGNMVYLLVNKDAEWVRKWGQKGLHMDGKLLTIDGRALVFAVRSYWQSELVSVGIKVLETLEALHNSKSNSSVFRRSTSLLHIFEVSKFLLGCQYLKLTNPYKKKLQYFLGISWTYFHLVFSLDWRKSVSKDLISLRETDLSVKLLDEIIHQYVDIKGDFTYPIIGRVMMICLGSKISVALYEHIINKLHWNPKWKSFVEKFRDDGFKEVLVSQAFTDALIDTFEALILQPFVNALSDTFTANRRLAGYISPESFLHLLDRNLFVNSWLCQTFYTTKSSFVGWFTFLHSPATPTILRPDQKLSPSLVNFYVQIVHKLLYNMEGSISSLQKSDIKHSYYLPILAVKLVMMLCLIFLQDSDCSQVLLDLLLNLLSGTTAHLLPKTFRCNLLKGRKGRRLNLNAEVVADAFFSIDDPLVIVCSEDGRPKIHAPFAIFVDLRNSKEDVMNVLFQRKTTLCVGNPSKNDGCGTLTEVTCSNTLVDANSNVNLVDEGELQMKRNALKEISEFINGRIGNFLGIIRGEAPEVKDLKIYIDALAAALEDGEFCTGEDTTVVLCVYSELKVLLEPFDSSLQKLQRSALREHFCDVLEWIHISGPKLKDFLKRYARRLDPKYWNRVVSESSSATMEDGNVYFYAAQKRERNKGKKGAKVKKK